MDADADADAARPICAKAIANAGTVGCVQRLDGSVRCSAYGGPLFEATDFGTNIVKVTADDDSICALSSEGSVSCISAEGPDAANPHGESISALGSDNVDIDTSSGRICVIKRTGEAVCLGSGEPEDATGPSTVADLGNDVVDVSVSRSAGCAVKPTDPGAP